jgi:UDP-N-acetylmuramoyl-L-alanyl-D-glutamate--2,6-diaminopimelate ligase
MAVRELAQEGDIILVAGKGHENYQEIKGIKHHFDDKEALAEAFEVN